MGFLKLARHDVLVGFHAGFDRLVLERAAREALGVRLPNAWQGLALLAAGEVRNDFICNGSGAAR